MGWNRTMNKDDPQKDVTVREEMEQYLAGLLTELNFRLLMETDVKTGDSLWVESVEVTDIRRAKKGAGRKKKGSPGTLFGRLWNGLSGIRDRIRFLKYKKFKERR